MGELRKVPMRKAPPPLPPLPKQLGPASTPEARQPVQEEDDILLEAAAVLGEDPGYLAPVPALAKSPKDLPAAEDEDLLSSATAALALGGGLRVIFLDVDGVLNNKRSRVVNDSPTPESLEHLRFLVESTQSKLVLSSTWRLDDRKKAEIESELLQCGLGIKGATPDLHRKGQGDRVDEILLWLEMRAAKSEHIQAWVAIDDLDLLRQNPRLNAQNFVRTDDAEGLTAEKAQEALRKLLQQSESP